MLWLVAVFALISWWEKYVAWASAATLDWTKWEVATATSRAGMMYMRWKCSPGLHIPTWDQQYLANCAVFAPLNGACKKGGRVMCECHWPPPCGHLSDARRNEGWFCPRAPHRVQSHYRPCQIQLVTEFAAPKKGGMKGQDGEAMNWISRWENSPLPAIKNRERDFFTLRCTSESGSKMVQFYLLAWMVQIRLAYFRESTQVK